MNSPLHKAPLGLIEIFNLKTLGRQPDLFSDTVAPTIDTRDFYSAGLLLASGTGGEVGALLNLFERLTLTAHVGVRGIGAILTIGAAGGTNVSITVGYENESGFRCPLGTHSFAAVFAGQIVEFGLPMRAVWPAGTRVYANAYAGSVAGADHLLQVFTVIEFFGAQQ